jgi:HEAT repeat protein
MANGDVMIGTVVAVEGSRAKVKTAEGLRMVDVRSIDCERLADGSEKYHPAVLTPGPLAAPAQALLQRLRKGDKLDAPDLSLLTAPCTQELVAALTGMLTAKLPAVREQAARALVLTATKEGVRAVLDAALADATGAHWRSVAGAMTAGAVLGAVNELEARADLEKAFASKDKPVRFATAWAAAKLGSTAALPVLATFVGDGDHHVREAAAMCLAERGDASGSKVLVVICRRERSPAMDANRDADPGTRAMLERAARAERLRACELLGRLRSADATGVLAALARHKDAGLAAAAQAAMAAIAGK